MRHANHRPPERENVAEHYARNTRSTMLSDLPSMSCRWPIMAVICASQVLRVISLPLVACVSLFSARCRHRHTFPHGRQLCPSIDDRFVVLLAKLTRLKDCHTGSSNLKMLVIRIVWNGCVSKKVAKSAQLPEPRFQPPPSIKSRVGARRACSRASDRGRNVDERYNVRRLSSQSSSAWHGPHLFYFLLRSLNSPIRSAG